MPGPCCCMRSGSSAGKTCFRWCPFPGGRERWRTRIAPGCCYSFLHRLLMRLFTFNFKQETPVLGFVMLVLLACEMSLRAWGPNISIDLLHIQSIPEIVTTLRNAPHPTLLFLGN